MQLRRATCGLIGGLTILAIGCAPVSPIARPAGPLTAVQAQPIADLRYVASIDPATHAITIEPADFRTQAVGVFVRSANAIWAAPVFSFDLLVTNGSGTTMAGTQGVVLSTTPSSPSVTAAGTSGLTATDSLPYYSYGSLANGATGTCNWKFSIPGATPFRFGFTIRSGAGVDAGPAKNHVPAISAVTPTSGSIGTGATTAVTATTSDPEADALTYTWSAPSGGSITGAGASVTYTAPGSIGTYPVNLTVDDGKGGTASSSTSISVTAGGGTGTAQGTLSFGNVPASATKRVTVSPATATINPGQAVAITAAALDNPGNAVSTKWFWSQTGSTSGAWRGTFDTGTLGTSASWLTFDGATQAGPVTVTARSTNNTLGSMTLTINEVAPVISSSAPAGAVFATAAGPVTTYNVVFHDGNGNFVAAPVVAFNRVSGSGGHNGAGFSYSTNPATGDRNFTFTVNGFTGTATQWVLSVAQSDIPGSTVTKTWTINVT